MQSRFAYAQIRRRIQSTSSSGGRTLIGLRSRGPRTASLSLPWTSAPRAPSAAFSAAAASRRQQVDDDDDDDDDLFAPMDPLMMRGGYSQRSASRSGGGSDSSSKRGKVGGRGGDDEVGGGDDTVRERLARRVYEERRERHEDISPESVYEETDDLLARGNLGPQSGVADSAGRLTDKRGHAVWGDPRNPAYRRDVVGKAGRGYRQDDVTRTPAAALPLGLHRSDAPRYQSDSDEEDGYGAQNLSDEEEEDEEDEDNEDGDGGDDGEYDDDDGEYDDEEEAGEGEEGEDDDDGEGDDGEESDGGKSDDDDGDLLDKKNFPDFHPSQMYRGGKPQELDDDQVRDVALRMRTNVNPKNFAHVKRALGEAEAYRNRAHPEDPLFVGAMAVNSDHEHFFLDPLGRKTARDKIHARKVERMQLRQARVMQRKEEGHDDSPKYRQEPGEDMTIRQKRVSELVQRMLEDIFNVDLRNRHSPLLQPLYGRVLIDRVVVAKDMQHAAVYVSGLSNTDKELIQKKLCAGRKEPLKMKRKGMPGMNRAARVVRHLLAIKLKHMQHNPELSFISSDSEELKARQLNSALDRAEFELKKVGML